MQDWSISSALATEMLQSCIKPSIWWWYDDLIIYLRSLKGVTWWNRIPYIAYKIPFIIDFMWDTHSIEYNWQACDVSVAFKQLCIIMLTRWRNAPYKQIRHYSDIIMSTRTSQITDVSIVWSTVCSGVDQTRHQSSTSLTFVRESTGDRWIALTTGQ